LPAVTTNLSVCKSSQEDIGVVYKKATHHTLDRLFGHNTSTVFLVNTYKLLLATVNHNILLLNGILLLVSLQSNALVSGLLPPNGLLIYNIFSVVSVFPATQVNHANCIPINALTQVCILDVVNVVNVFVLKLNTCGNHTPLRIIRYIP
jgi:hypothetical protein